MSLNVLEVALYAMVLSGGSQPVSCERHEAAEPVVRCSDGRVATRDDDNRIRFMDGIVVLKGQGGALAFSNGVTSHWGSAGWVQFTNNVAVRRTGDGSFKSSGRLTCRALSEDKAACSRED